MNETQETADQKKGGNGRSFLPLYVTNFFGTLNDNFLKTLAGFTVIDWIADERLKSIAMGVTAGALVLPYILCSPLADRLTAVWSKRRIVQIAKWAELPIMAVAIAGFLFKSPWLVVGAVLLMGLQSSLYSPAKYALIRDIGGAGRISTGMGGMEGTCGALCGAVMALGLLNKSDTPSKMIAKDMLQEFKEMSGGATICRDLKGIDTGTVSYTHLTLPTNREV